MKINIPRILFLVLSTWNKYKDTVFNTNTLAEIINAYETARLRNAKKDYKYGQDTKFGGLRGNLSTLLTWKGFVKRGSRIVSFYAIGIDKRILNAIKQGEISLDYKEETCVTQNPNLAKLLQKEEWLRNLREGQAHIKIFLQKNPTFPLKRDNANFPKEAVLISAQHVMFLRALVNTLIDKSQPVLQYLLLPLWEGKKLNLFNIHPLFVLPSIKNIWQDFYAIPLEELMQHKPMLININLQTKECTDEYGNQYNLIPLDEALDTFSDKSGNIEWRSAYRWKSLQESYCKQEIENKYKKEDEFSVFLSQFLHWKDTFCIGEKEVRQVTVISSGGPDVLLTFSGGTTQKLELEHEWHSYIRHKHYQNPAFQGCWLYANEPFDFMKIKQLFSPYLQAYSSNIPKIFLTAENGKKKAFRINWENQQYEEIKVTE